MKRLALTIAVLAALACTDTTASASDFSRLFWGNRHHVRHNNHVRHHDDLYHRSYHRQQTHRDVHRYPITYRQHGRLHDSLNHEGFHDSLEHSSAHGSHAYTPHYRFGSGIGFRSSHGAIWFGF